MHKQLRRLERRLRSSFPLLVITLLATCGVLAVTPFAIYRLIQGNYLMVVAEACTLIALVAAVAYAWRTHDTTRTGFVMVSVLSLTAILASVELGAVGLLWVFPLMLTSFFVVTPGYAAFLILTVCGLLVTAHLFGATPLIGHELILSFLVTCLVSTLLTYLFAKRLFTQRDHLQQLALIDPLTGALNRRAMQEQLQHVSQDRRNVQGYGLLLLDLDFFKQVNDDFGHPVGDRALIDLVALVKGILRQNDRLFRFGGEEFAILAPAMNVQALHAIAEKVRLQIFNNLQAGDRFLTVSIGGALLRGGEDGEQWLARVDQALYQVKSAGRNSVHIVEDS